MQIVTSFGCRDWGEGFEEGGVMLEAETFMAGFMSGLVFGLTVVSQRVRAFLSSKKPEQVQESKKVESNATD